MRQLVIQVHVSFEPGRYPSLAVRRSSDRLRPNSGDGHEYSGKQRMAGTMWGHSLTCLETALGNTVIEPCDHYYYYSSCAIISERTC